MTIEIKVPVLPESVADATVVNWHKNVGDSIKRDEVLVDLETDKVVLEVPAPQDGVLQAIQKEVGATVVADEMLGLLGKATAQAAAAPAQPTAAAPVASTATSNATVEPPVSAPAAVSDDLSPAVRRIVAEHDVDTTQITGSGKGGRITKEDVDQFIQQRRQPADTPAAVTTAPAAPISEARTENRVPMSRLRAKVAERLLQAQQNAALLTTFNEINLQAVMDLRSKYKDSFEKRYGVRLGFMSFFTKAAVEALKRFPAVNASVDGTDILYHNYYDVGIAVSTERGLVVPVLRDVNDMSMADIEAAINDYAARAKQGKLGIEEMQGGTFTITNGGVFGSLLSTPIINPPQTGILGMHKIEQRAVVENGQVVARPMMYVALSYDHRIIDGKDSVQFLVTIKELLEDPARLLLDI